MSPEREPMSPIDAAWLHMDSPSNPMIITALLWFDERVSLEELGSLVEKRLLGSRRFRQRIADSRLPGKLPRWENDPGFELRAHIHRVAVPWPADDAALAELVGQLMSTPLDRTRPLWRLYLVEGLSRGSAVVARIHHCMGDGVALVGLMLSLTDAEASPAPELVGVVPEVKHGLERVRQLGTEASSLARTLLLPKEPESPLRGELGQEKRAAWSKKLRLEGIKAAARVRGVHVNDVLMACAAGALRRYVERRGSTLTSELRALVPMYVRGDNGSELGNHFGLVFLDLPTAADDRDERVREIHRRMELIKAGPEATVALVVLAGMGVASATVQQLGVNLFTGKASVMMTNVPGPPVPIELIGKKLDGMMMWAPVSGVIGLSLSILSYAGVVRLGVASDARVVPDPDSIARAFEAELAALTPAKETPTRPTLARAD